MPITKKSRKGRKGKGRGGKRSKFPEFPSDVDIMKAVMAKNLQDMKNSCNKQTFGLYLFVYCFLVP